VSIKEVRDRLACLGAVALLVTCSVAASAGANEELARYQAAAKLATQHLATFDTLDFDVFTNQKWDRLKESHSKDIDVHWPDGHVTHGIDKHIEDLKAMFVYAPDTRIQVHSVKIAQGEWTSVVGVMEGTFTKPMPTGDGKAIAPTGKAFKLNMCTVGHWVNGVMDQEYLFWDNQTFMRQIGLAK
jgi:predicted ester cyclase